MTTEKMDQHYHQQLSALMDGDLDPDQARFLLRRLQHDQELTGCWERWQLCGDVLRGQAQAPAPAGFADRVALAVAAEPSPAATRATSRSRLARWGGGALAASVAAMALFMGRQLLPEQAPVPAAAVASQAPSAPGLGPLMPDSQPDANATAGATSVEAGAAAAAAGVAVASAPLRPSASRTGGGSATRTRQAARPAAVRAPERAVASAGGVPVIHAIAATPDSATGNPFGDVRVESPTARPWPRAVLPRYSDQAAYSAGFATGVAPAAGSFHPFEPRLPEVAPVRPPVPPPEPVE